MSAYYNEFDPQKAAWLRELIRVGAIAPGDVVERSIADVRRENGGVRGPVNGFWRDADWVLTRPQRVGDRPGLRPVERGAQQMVDEPAEDLGRVRHTGFPLAEKAEARVMRLRGYGDGIVAEQAAAFVRAYMEVRG